MTEIYPYASKGVHQQDSFTIPFLFHYIHHMAGSQAWPVQRNARQISCSVNKTCSDLDPFFFQCCEDNICAKIYNGKHAVYRRVIIAERYFLM